MLSSACSDGWCLGPARCYRTRPGRLAPREPEMTRTSLIIRVNESKYIYRYTRFFDRIITVNCINLHVIDLRRRPGDQRRHGCACSPRAAVNSRRPSMLAVGVKLHPGHGSLSQVTPPHYACRMARIQVQRRSRVRRGRWRARTPRATSGRGRAQADLSAFAAGRPSMALLLRITFSLEVSHGLQPRGSRMRSVRWHGWIVGCGYGAR
jgi:hypothetical protein